MRNVYVILALWTHVINAQQVGDIAGGSGGNRKNAVDTSNVFSEYNYLSSGNNNKTLIHSLPYPSLIYNTNPGDSLGNTHAFAENHLLSNEKSITNKNKSHQNESTRIANNLSTKSPKFEVNSITTEAPVGREITKGYSFNAKLVDIMSSEAQDENLVYSPISLQTILAFLFTISEGKLYEELAQLLAISNNRTYVAKTFENILKAAALNPPPTTLIMANKLYYDYRFGPIDPTIRNFAKNSFDSEMEEINFFTFKKAANTINSWVRETTRDLIRDIITPSAIAADTSALLLNSIYFKGEWLTKFGIYDTETQDFYKTKQIKVPIDMMYNEDVFRYADFSDDLQASVVELPYKMSNISMLIILPKDIEGLAGLERKLRYYDLNTISQKLKREIVTVKLPRFKIEYETDMISPLQKMGLNALFNNAAGINLFKNQQKPFKIDQFKHKSFINVNEAGTEAAATTVAKYVPLSIPTDMKYFVADHPFVFVIQDSNTIYFMGHVVEF